MSFVCVGRPFSRAGDFRLHPYIHRLQQTRLSHRGRAAYFCLTEGIGQPV